MNNNEKALVPDERFFARRCELNAPFYVFHDMEPVHDGQIIREYIQTQGIKSTRLASLLHLSRPNLSLKLTRGDLRVSFLYEVSRALNHDFFADLSASYSRRASLVPPSQPLPGPLYSFDLLWEEIARLKQEVAELKQGAGGKQSQCVQRSISV